MTTLQRKMLIVGLPLVAIASVVLLQFIMAAPLYAMNNKFWDDTNGVCDINYCGQQTIKNVSGETQFVRRMGTNVQIYFTSGGQKTIRILNGNFCPTASNNADTIQSGDYYSSHAISSERVVTKFQTGQIGYDFNDPVLGRYYTSGSSQCNDPLILTSEAIQDPKITRKPLFKIDLLVYNNLTHPTGVCHIDGQCSGVVNYFDIVADDTTAKIAQINYAGDYLGYDGTLEKIRDPLDGGVPPNTQDIDFTDYVVKFGSPCNLPGPREVTMWSYDLDFEGGAGAQVDRDIKTSLEWFAPDGTSGYEWQRRPPPEAKKLDNRATPFNFPAKVGYRYKWTIHNVYENNIVQFSPPVGFDGIFWENTPNDPLCLPINSRASANTTVDNQTGTVPHPNNTAGTHTFRHYVNVDYVKDYDGSVDWQIETSTDGVNYSPGRESGIEVVDRAQKDNADALVSTPYVWTVPTNSSGYYCERLKLSNPRPPSNVAIVFPNPSDGICISYINNGGPVGAIPRIVEFIPQGGGVVKEEPEVRVDTNINELYANLGSKPATNELGYTKQAEPRSPNYVQQAVLSSPTPQGENPRVLTRERGATPNYKTHQEPPGSSNWVKDIPEVILSYSCPGGWYGGGADSKCYQDYTIYDWYCYEDQKRPLAKGTESAGGGCKSLKSWSPCIDSRYGGDEWTFGGPLNCQDTWSCPYDSGTAIRGEGAPPLCEYRCDGTGPRAIWATENWQRNPPSNKYFDIHNGRDYNCYQPWRVTVSCQITYTATGGVWYRPNGSILPAGSVQSWNEIITTDVWGNMSNYCINPPGGYWATQYEYGAIGSQGCAVLSLAAIGGFVGEPPATGSPLSPNNRPLGNRPFNWTAVKRNPVQKCWVSIGRPYVQFNNTDISTMNCGTGTGNVTLWAKTDYGSSVEYAAYVAGSIDSLRTNYNNGGQGLAFASDGSKTIGGGNFGSKSGGACTYYDALLNGADSTFVATHIKNYGTSVTLNQGVVDSFVTSTGSYAIFADNVTIDGNISLPFQLRNDSSDLNQAGQKVLYIVAKNVIQVTPGVSQIDASLISDGTINTCIGSANQCENNLTINGGLSASRVQFKRNGFSSLNCARPDRGSICGPYNRASEVVNYGGYYEMFMPPFKPVGGLDQGKYDSVRNLAPIF